MLRGRAGTAPVPAPGNPSRRTVLAAAPALALTGGISVPNDSPDWTTNVTTPQSLAAGSPFTLAAGTQTVDIAINPSVYTIGIALDGSTSMTTLSVTGDQTSAVYLSLSTLRDPIGPVQYVPVMSAVDTSVTIKIISSATVTMNVVLMGQSAGAVVYPGNGIMPVEIDRVNVVMPVTQDANSFTPWLRPSFYQFIDTGSIALNAAVTVIPGVAGEHIYLHDLIVQPIDGGQTINIYDGSATGTQIHTVYAGATGTPVNTYIPPVPPLKFSGLVLGLGTGLTLKSTSAGTHRWLGYATYSQA